MGRYIPPRFRRSATLRQRVRDRVQKQRIGIRMGGARRRLHQAGDTEAGGEPLQPERFVAPLANPGRSRHRRDMRRRRSEEQCAQFSRDGTIASNDFGEQMIK